MKKMKYYLTPIATFCCIFLIGSVVRAATFLTYGWPKAPYSSFTTIPINSYSYNSTWQSAMDSSLTNWNTSPARVMFSKNSCSNYVYAAQYAYDDYGVNYATRSGSALVKFKIELNARTISRDAYNFSNFVQSVFVHELGHSIWLDDDPGTTSDSIMKHSRYRDSLINPTDFDTTNVNKKY